MKNIAVIGGGYVGLVTAVCLAEMGHKVNLIEIDPEKVRTLERNVMPISEPGLTELWRDNRAKGRLHVTGHYIEGLLGVDFAFITVGTPSARNGKPELKWVRLAAENIAAAASGSLMVIIKSTVPVGTAENVAKILAARDRNGYTFSVVSNPEFLREGSAINDFMKPARIVVGSLDAKANEAVAGLFETINSPFVMCDNRTAELSKYASNVFLATRISFMNEIALLCDEYGVDIVKVAEIIGLDPRFGKGYLNAGLGWGGNNLPKDVRAFINMAKESGIPLRLVRAVRQINEQQLYIVVKKLCQMLGSLENKTVGILGLSFKPNSGDIREARSLPLISLLEEKGCKIKAHDPVAMESAARLLFGVDFCTDAYEVARDSDALILVTEWDAFKKLDMKKMSSLMKFPVFIDARNMFDRMEMIESGFIYEGIGRSGLKNSRVKIGSV